MPLLLMVLGLLVLTALPARAICTVTGVQPSSMIVTVTPNYAGSALTYSFTVAFTLTLSGTNGTCSVGAAFHGTSSTPRMTDSGGHFLAYTLATYYSTTPGTKATGSFANPNTGTLALTYNTSLTITASQNASTGTPNGIYQDLTLTLNVFQTATSNTVVGSIPITVTATVKNPTTCTIGGSASGGTQNVDFSNGRTISTGTKVANFGAVTCNSPATLTLTSSKGAVTSATAAAGGHTNLFNYVAATTVNAGTVTLDTSTVSTATGPESATGRITALTTTGSPLAVNITPIAPATPLVAGSYSDVLTLTITPD